MIILVRHAETVFDLTLDEVHASFQLLAEVKRWMDATYQPQGYNVVGGVERPPTPKRPFQNNV